MDTYDDEIETMANWHRHGITRRSAELFKRRTDEAFHELRSACENSSDGNVAKAYGRWLALSEVAAYLRPKGTDK